MPRAVSARAETSKLDEHVDDKSNVAEVSKLAEVSKVAEASNVEASRRCDASGFFDARERSSDRLIDWVASVVWLKVGLLVSKVLVKALLVS